MYHVTHIPMFSNRVYYLFIFNPIKLNPWNKSSFKSIIYTY